MKYDVFLKKQPYSLSYVASNRVCSSNKTPTLVFRVFYLCSFWRSESRGAEIFQKYSNHFKTLADRMVPRSTYPTENPQILGAIV